MESKVARHPRPLIVHIACAVLAPVAFVLLSTLISSAPYEPLFLTLSRFLSGLSSLVFLVLLLRYLPLTDASIWRAIQTVVLLWVLLIGGRSLSIATVVIAPLTSVPIKFLLAAIVPFLVLVIILVVLERLWNLRISWLARCVISSVSLIPLVVAPSLVTPYLKGSSAASLYIFFELSKALSLSLFALLLGLHLRYIGFLTRESSSGATFGVTPWLRGTIALGPPLIAIVLALFGIVSSYTGICYGFTDGSWPCSFADHLANQMFWASFAALMFAPIGLGWIALVLLFVKKRPSSVTSPSTGKADGNSAGSSNRSIRAPAFRLALLSIALVAAIYVAIQQESLPELETGISDIRTELVEQLHGRGCSWNFDSDQISLINDSYYDKLSPPASRAAPLRCKRDSKITDRGRNQGMGVACIVKAALCGESRGLADAAFLNEVRQAIFRLPSNHDLTGLFPERARELLLALLARNGFSDLLSVAEEVLQIETAFDNSATEHANLSKSRELAVMIIAATKPPEASHGAPLLPLTVPVGCAQIRSTTISKQRIALLRRLQGDVPENEFSFLMELTSDPDPLIASEALVQLSRLVAKDERLMNRALEWIAIGSQPLRIGGTASLGYLARNNNGALATLFQLLADRDLKVVDAARRGLRTAGAARVMPTAMLELSRAPSIIRTQLAYLVSEFGEEGVAYLRPMVALLPSLDEKLLSALMVPLARLAHDNDEAWNLLIGYLRHPDKQVRANAIWSLQFAKRSYSQIDEELKKGREKLGTANYVNLLQYVGEYGPITPGVTEALRISLEGDNGRAQHAALVASRKLDIPALRSRTQSFLRGFLISAIDNLNSESKAIRRTTVATLAKLLTSERARIQPILLYSLWGENHDVRNSALEALSELLGEAPEIEQLFRLLSSQKLGISQYQVKMALTKYAPLSYSDGGEQLLARYFQSGAQELLIPLNVIGWSDAALPLEQATIQIDWNGNSEEELEIDRVLNELRERVKDIRQVRARYVRRQRIGDEFHTYEGTVSVEQPSKRRLVQRLPKPELKVSNGRNSWTRYATGPIHERSYDFQPFIDTSPLLTFPSNGTMISPFGGFMRSGRYHGNLSFVGEASCAEKSCLLLSRSEGAYRSLFYVDKDTGLLARREQYLESPQFGQKVGLESEWSYSAIEINPLFEESEFAKP